jgi:aryl-alcohol dehydrogenase-like predicted oxidoreductase
MQLRPLGSSGLRVSLIGLGCNNFGRRIDFEATRKVIDGAIALGINHFDTADVYGGDGKSEEFIGALLGDRRKSVVIATKFGKLAEAVPGTRGSRAYVMKAAEASLKRLKTDWIDLYYMHEPDPRVPIEETLAALNDLMKAGKVRAIGASNFSAAEIAAAAEVAKKAGLTRFVASQDEYSLLNRGIEAELVPELLKRRLSLIPYFPLGAGALSGKYRKGKPLPEGARITKGGYEQFVTPANLEKVERLHEFAEKRGHALLELALSWLARRAMVASIITGATRPEQLDANVRATDWALTPAEMADIERITAAS